MKQTIAERSADLLKAFSKHRKALRDNAKAISAMQRANNWQIDLKPYRARYLSGKVTGDPECSIVWRGWLHAVEECQQWDDVSWVEDCLDRLMACLLDERKGIKSAGARILNRLRIIGDQLLRAEP